MKKLIIVLSICVFLIAAGCSRPRYTMDYQPKKIEEKKAAYTKLIRALVKCYIQGHDSKGKEGCNGFWVGPDFEKNLKKGTIKFAGAFKFDRWQQSDSYGFAFKKRGNDGYLIFVNLPKFGKTTVYGFTQGKATDSQPIEYCFEFHKRAWISMLYVHSLSKSENGKIRYKTRDKQPRRDKKICYRNMEDLEAVLNPLLSVYDKIKYADYALKPEK